MIIKVCGMRDPENIREVAVLGIDWIGLIFFAGISTKNNRQWTINIDNGSKPYSELSIAYYQLSIKKSRCFCQCFPRGNDGNGNILSTSITCNCTETKHRMIAMRLQKRGYSLIKSISDCDSLRS